MKASFGIEIIWHSPMIFKVLLGLNSGHGGPDFIKFDGISWLFDFDEVGIDQQRQIITEGSNRWASPISYMPH